MGGKAKTSNTAAAIERPGYALLQDVPNYTEAGQKVTASRLEEIARVMPKATEQRGLVSDIILSELRGEKSKDVEQQTMRNIAEYAGAGFNPATAGRAGGFQMAQGLVPRQFGELSSNIQQRGISNALTWQQLADTFTYDPFEAAGFAGPSQAYGQQKASAQAYDDKINAANQTSQTNKIIGAVGTAAAIGGAFFTGGATLSLLPTTMGMMGGGSAGGGGGMGGIGQFGGGAGMGFTNPFAGGFMQGGMQPGTNLTGMFQSATGTVPKATLPVYGR